MKTPHTDREITNREENPLLHDTWKLLSKYRDVTWSLELSVQQVKKSFEIEYIHCGETPNILQDDTRLRQTVESIVQEVLERRNGISKKQHSLSSEEVPLRKIHRSAGISTNMEKLDDETLSAIRDSLSAFRTLET